MAVKSPMSASTGCLEYTVYTTGGGYSIRVSKYWSEIADFPLTTGF